MRRSLLLILLLTTISVFAQDLRWANSIGKNTYDLPFNGAVVDSKGNTYKVGYFRAQVDFNPGVGTYYMVNTGDTSSTYDGYIQKLDSNGNFVWAKKIGGSGDDWILAVTIDEDDNVILSGYFEGTVDFDPNGGTYNLSGGSGSYFVLKLNSSGNFVWAIKNIDGTHGGDVKYITTDKSNNILVLSQFSGTIDFDPSGSTSNLTSNGGTDMFIQKLDANGGFIWAKNIGGIGNDSYSRGIKANMDNDVYVVGAFQDSVDFDPSGGVYKSYSNGNIDGFVVKLDSMGTFEWNATFGSTLWDIVKGFDLDVNNNVYLTGFFEGTVDFDPGVGSVTLSSSGFEDAFILKLNNSGDFVWVKSIQSNSSDEGTALSVDVNGDLYVGGNFSGTSTDLDPGAGVYNVNNNGSTDIFITKLNTNGEFVWGRSVGGTNNDRCDYIGLDVSNNIYISGRFKGTTDFDPNTGVTNLTSTSPVKNDIYTFSLNNYFVPCNVDYTTINDSICSGDSLYFDGSYIKLPGVYKDTLTNANNCDSIVTLNLTYVTPSNCGTTLVNQLFNNDFKVYPNPSTGRFTVEAILDDEYSFSVLGINGEIIKTGVLNGTTKVNMLEVKNGLYLLQLTNKNSVMTKRLVIQK